VKVGVLAAAILWLAGSQPPAAQGLPQERTYLARATALQAAGRFTEALDVLREARTLYRGTELYPDILLLSARAAQAAGDVFRSRYFLGETVRVAPTSKAALLAGRELGDLLYADRLYAEALAAYIVAAAETDGALGVPAEVELRIAEIASLHLDEQTTARQHITKVDPERLTPNERELYRIVLARARWEALPLAALGLSDPNISALALDSDDLWVGTWSGGLSRYARSTRTPTVFHQAAGSLVANTVRSIEVTDRYVWVGTDQGLSQYSKATSRWRAVEPFAGPRPMKVQATHGIGNRLYVATLGDGLWVLDGNTWRRVGEGILPTSNITAIEATDQGLLVGTLDAGLFRIRGDGGPEVLWDRPAPGIGSRNITALLATDPVVWVATYGEGLWEWRPASGTVVHHTSRTGALGDDWVMCAAQGDDVSYFGTFGGGVSYVDAAGRWGRLDLSDGLASRDVMAVEGAGPAVYFGTLGAGVTILHRLAGDLPGQPATAPGPAVPRG
jgi:ligand-binding sensor domain-containing protein